MTHTGTPKPFRTRSLKVRLAQTEWRIAAMEAALQKIELDAYQARRNEGTALLFALERIHITAQDALSANRKEAP